MRLQKTFSSHPTIETLCEMAYRGQYHEVEQTLLNSIRCLLDKPNTTSNIENFLYTVYISFNHIYLTWSKNNNRSFPDRAIDKHSPIHPNFLLSHAAHPPEMDDLLYSALSLRDNPDAKKELMYALDIYSRSIAPS